MWGFCLLSRVTLPAPSLLGLSAVLLHAISVPLVCRTKLFWLFLFPGRDMNK